MTTHIVESVQLFNCCYIVASFFCWQLFNKKNCH